MDHEVVPRSCKICDWLLNLSWDHFNLHRGKKCQSGHGVRGPLKRHIVRPMSSTNMVFVVGEAKRSSIRRKRRRSKGPWQRIVVIIIYDEICLGNKR